VWEVEIKEASLGAKNHGHTAHTAHTHKQGGTEPNTDRLFSVITGGVPTADWRINPTYLSCLTIPS